MSPTPIEDRLASLHAHYTRRINAAVAAGRMDLVRDLANDFHDEALDQIEAFEWPAGRPETAEILEFGGWSRWRAPRSHAGKVRFWPHLRRRGSGRPEL